MEEVKLWEQAPGFCNEEPVLKIFLPKVKKSNGAVVIFPGGGYVMRAEYEGEGYAEFLNNNGICAFVCEYRVFPHKFPSPLVDARRAIKYVRANADKYGIDKNKVFVMGSSAGGHLAALVSTYYDKLDTETNDAIDQEDFVPNGQILCYPVIKLVDDDMSKVHEGSAKALLGHDIEKLSKALSPNLITSQKTPQAFIWHTFNDNVVHVSNSLDYAKALRNENVPVEMHIYPDGPHGLGLADVENRLNPHVANWSDNLIRWFKFIDFID